jgi:hypothetical protein
MEKTLDKLMSVITRAEYIEVEPNVQLHVTDAGRRQTYCVIARMAVKR